MTDDSYEIKPGICAICGTMTCRTCFDKVMTAWENMPINEKAKTNIFLFAIDYMVKNTTLGKEKK